MSSSNLDLLYAVLGVILGIVMVFSPRVFMRGAKYDEDSLKTEMLVKKMGIGVVLLAIIYAIYTYLK